MTAARPDTAAPDAAAAPAPLPVVARLKVLAYLAALVFLPGLADPGGGLIGMPISFVLKNKLHLEAHETAAFGLIALVPVYLGFLFGFARDMFSPFRLKDRGFIILFGAACAAVYALAAFTPVSAAVLLTAAVLVGCGFMFVVSAQNGLMSTLAGQHAMSGQASANQNLAISSLTILTMLAGGALSDRLEKLDAAGAVRAVYLLGAAIMTAVALFGLWRPRTVFDNVRSEHPQRARPWREVLRLLRHRPLYPALLIWLLWDFNPGDMTPLMYHLQNHFHATDGQWSLYSAIQFAAFLPTYLLYGWLCRRFRLQTLLWWGAVIAVPQYVCLAFIHSMNDAYIAAVFVGLLGGVATAAFLDLIIRSCPHGLQATVLMLSTALLNIAQRLGDVLGSWLYERSGGFLTCVIAVTVVYALILPVLLFVDHRLIDTADGAPEADGAH